MIPCRIGWIFLVLFLLILGCGKEKKKLVFATDTTLIPMSFVGDDGKIAGFEPDLINKISKIAGFDYELVNVEWAGLTV